MKVAELLSRLRVARARVKENRVQLTILSMLVAVGLVLSLVAALTGDPQDWRGFLLNLGTEMIGAVVTYVLLQEVIGTRVRKADLIAQMGSEVRDVAVPAADELRRQGWLGDGSLRGAYLARASLRGANLTEANFQGANLIRANLPGCWLAKTNLHKVNLGGANLQGAVLLGANVQEADLLEANLQEANLGEANLQGATLWGADFQRATLLGANHQEADLRGANLQETDLLGANFQGVDLRFTDLSTTRDLNTSKLDGAKADSTTKWPEGFEVPDTVEMVED